MIFLNLDEVFLDRVGHAAAQFNYEIPSGVEFGMRQLANSLDILPSILHKKLEVGQWSDLAIQDSSARCATSLPVQ